jgi:hypothetical protein
MKAVAPLVVVWNDLVEQPVGCPLVPVQTGKSGDRVVPVT